jgi:PKD repeat protein
MNKIYARSWLKYAFLAILVGLSTVTFTNSGGPSAGLTGAPGDGNCTNCHSGSPVTSGTAFDAISITGLPSGGYAPGTSYTLTLNGGAAATAKNGFQLIALSPSNTMAGSFTSGTGSQAMVGGGGKTYLGHTSAGNTQSSWTYTWTAPNPSVGTVTFYVALNATNSNSGTGGDVVYLKTITVSGGNLPVATITSPTAPAVFCAGDSIQFTGTATNSPLSYAWDFLGNSPSSSTLQNPKIRFANAGFYTVRFRATNSSGTSTNAQLTLQVVAKPTATITPSGNQTICGGDSVTLTANSGANLSYLWSPGNQTTQTIKVGASGNYSVRVSSLANCFTNSSAVTMTVAPKPTLSATLSSNTLCIGDSLEIVATPGLQNYKYYLGSTLMDSSNRSTVKFQVMNSFTNVYVIGSNGICNTDPIVRTVTISSKPSAPVIACGPIFPNSVAFTITGTNPQISLDSGKTFITPNQGNTHVINGLNPNTQVLAYARTTASAPCLFSLSSNKTCASANCTPLTLKITAPKYVCPSSPISNRMIRIVSTNAINPYFKYDYPPPSIGSGWTKNDSFPANNSFVGSQIHKVTVIDSANAFCPTKDTSFSVFVVAFPGAQPTIQLDKTQYCEGGSITFNVTNPNSNINKVKYYTVIGSNRTEFAAKAKPDYMYGPVPLSPNFPNGTIVTAQTIDTISGCGIFSPNKTISVGALPKVGFTYTKLNLEVNLTDTTNNTIMRSWTFDGIPIVKTTLKTYSYVFASYGIKTIKMDGFTDAGCESSTSTQINIVASGLLEAANAMGMELFPNPASNEVSISWTNGGSGSIELFDVSGKLVLTAEVSSGNKLNLAGLTKGVYLLKLSNQDQSAFKKLIIE